MTRLLIVDDTVERESLRKDVEAELGWEVVPTPRPDELGEVLAEYGPFDIAVVDLGLGTSQ